MFATVGVHPSEASELPFETESEKLLALLKEGGVIGVGECGIKRTETTTEDDLEKQKQWFRFQVKTAQQLGLPLFLNEQNGFDVLFQIIKEEARASQRDTLSVPALVNCFNSSEEALESYLSMGFYIGVTGLLCNDARNQNLLPLISKIPLDRLVLLLFSLPFSFNLFLDSSCSQLFLIFVRSFVRSSLMMMMISNDNAGCVDGCALPDTLHNAQAIPQAEPAFSLGARGDQDR